MANLQKRLDKFLEERRNIHATMKPFKEALVPLTKRLIQVNKNISSIETLIRQSKV